MKKTLVIVESPTKIKTLKEFLGANYLFASTMGHIRDLPKKGMGVDIDHDFQPQYELLPEKKEVIEKLKKAANAVDIILLATDPDREGEAIAWHISSILPQNKEIKRVTFNAITKNTVVEALKHPRDIDLSLVNTQQARRILDRVVGYTLSPHVNRKVRSPGGYLSAGRVQSVALKLVTDRETQILQFLPQEYWVISAELKTPNGESFIATLSRVGSKKIGKPGQETKSKEQIIGTEDQAQNLLKKLETASFAVKSIIAKERKRNAPAPFITSTLQQEASRHFSFSVSRTMQIAQSLYEGIEGSEGLITYMRTDSFRIEPQECKKIRAMIKSNFGADYLPKEATLHKSKKNAQDAHEAIRPSSVDQNPESLRSTLSHDQYRLYKLIWERTIASQMSPALYDTVSCDIESNTDISLHATGSTLRFKGFLAVYEEKNDEPASQKEGEEPEEKEGWLPPLASGMVLIKEQLFSKQSFTKPPGRFTEASLIKELEKQGIGRPSTYVSIMTKIESRDYTTKEKGVLKPTELGMIIARLLEDSFPDIMNVSFTAALENQLDTIIEENKNWQDILNEFWKSFKPQLIAAEESGQVPKQETDLDCPECGHKLQKIWSKHSYFYGCSHYPECHYRAGVESYHFNKEDYDPNFDWDQPCVKCQGSMRVCHGKYGAFLGCTKYPECKSLVNIPKKGEQRPEDLPPCPAHGCDGRLTMRRSRFGKPFLSCSAYPDCDVIGNTPEEIAIKYKEHPKTPYIKKESSTTKKSSSNSKTKAPSKKKSSTPTKKTTRKKKEPS